MAAVHVHRSRARWKDRLRAYTVYLNGRDVMRLKNGESKAIEVAAGNYELQAWINSTSSNHVDLVLADGEVVHLELRADGTLEPDQNAADAGLDLSPRRGSYLVLSRIERPPS